MASALLRAHWRHTTSPEGTCEMVQKAGRAASLWRARPPSIRTAGTVMSSLSSLIVTAAALVLLAVCIASSPPSKAREPIPASGLGVRHNPAGPAELFSDALQGLPEGTCKGVSREDAERRMVRPKEHFDGVDLPLGLRDADGSDGVGQLAHDDLLHRLLVGVYEGACWKDAERRMIRPEQGLDCVDRPRGLRDADGSDSILELNGN